MRIRKKMNRKGGLGMSKVDKMMDFQAGAKISIIEKCLMRILAPMRKTKRILKPCIQ